ncbi:MAG: hypothetical protein SVK08_02485 [Halobacteriota archaeon]|nr:hypothetical protein [Halobacteriota archaeon]
MGREVKRVPMDFDWPLEQVWDGYVNDKYVACPECMGRGFEEAYERLMDAVDVLRVSANDAFRSKDDEPIDVNPRTGRRVTPEKTIIDLVRGLVGEEPMYFSMSRYLMGQKIIEASGLDPKWGTCKRCNGDGIHPGHKDEYKAWRPTEPPKGIGYQIWETVSEGSPISPVFENPEDLAKYMVENDQGRRVILFICRYGWVHKNRSGGYVWRMNSVMVHSTGKRRMNRSM